MMIKHLYGENPIVKELSKSEIAAKLIYRAKNPIRDPLNQKKVYNIKIIKFIFAFLIYFVNGIHP